MICQHFRDEIRIKCTLHFHLYCKSRCFWRNLHRWQKFYTAAGSDGIDKSHLCHGTPYTIDIMCGILCSIMQPEIYHIQYIPLNDIPYSLISPTQTIPHLTPTQVLMCPLRSFAQPHFAHQHHINITSTSHQLHINATSTY